MQNIIKFMNNNSPIISIIGIGRVGTLLAHLFAEKGFSFGGFLDKDIEKAERIQSAINQGKVFDNLNPLLKISDIIFITTSDDQIEAVVKEISISTEKIKGKFFIHTSGLHSTQILQPLSKKEAVALSMHPCASVVALDSFASVTFVLEGSPKAISLGKHLSEIFQAKALVMEAKIKPLYHFGTALLSNMLVLIFYEVINMYKKVGIEDENIDKALIVLLKSTLSNIERKGVSKALTGPIARGDLNTVIEHLSLKKQLSFNMSQAVLPLFKASIELAIRENYISSDIGEKLMENLKNY